MSETVIATLTTAVPCGVYKAELDGICGRPATVIILDPSPAPLPLQGRWAGLPMCPVCVAELAAVYQVPTAEQWLTLADAAIMAHEQQPEKYGQDTYVEGVKLRALIKRNDWKGRGWAKKTVGGSIWLVERIAFQRYLNESAGKYVRQGDGA